MESDRRGLRKVERPFMSPGDVRLLAELPLLALAARILPERRWNAFCLSLERVFGDSPAGQVEIARRIAALGRPFGPTGPALPPEELPPAIGAARREHYMQAMRAWRPGRPPRFSTPTRLSGNEILDAALAGRTGVVLWIAHFAFAPIATKAALAAAGYRAWHMSRPEHGFSKTRLGIAVLNPIRWRVEAHYLAGRLAIDRRNPAAVTLRATRLLADNAIISITAGDWEGARVLQVPVGPATLGLSSGAPALAHLAGAPLLPVFAVRPSLGDGIAVIVDRPIRAPRDAGRSAFVELAAAEFIERTRPFIDRWPEQWRDWSRLRLGEPAKPGAGGAG